MTISNVLTTGLSGTCDGGSGEVGFLNILSLPDSREVLDKNVHGLLVGVVIKVQQSNFSGLHPLDDLKYSHIDL